MEDDEDLEIVNTALAVRSPRALQASGLRPPSPTGFEDPAGRVTICQWENEFHDDNGARRVTQCHFDPNEFMPCRGHVHGRPTEG